MNKVGFLFLLSWLTHQAALGQATTFLEKENDINKNDISRVYFEFRQEEKLAVIPFYGVVSRADKKGRFYPLVHIIAKNSVKNIGSFKFTLYEDTGEVLLSDSSQLELDLNNILDYRSLAHNFNKRYTVKKLIDNRNSENLMVSYEFTAHYFDGHSERLAFDKKVLIRTKERKFKPMF